MLSVLLAAACAGLASYDGHFTEVEAPLVVYPLRMVQQQTTPTQPPTPPRPSHQLMHPSAATTPAWNMSGLVGAEYTPWRVGNQLWWHNFSDYADDVAREVKAMRTVFGFTAVRMFLHDMLYFNNSAALKSNMNLFLGILDAEGMKAGFVFFDDCWQVRDKHRITSSNHDSIFIILSIA